MSGTRQATMHTIMYTLQEPSKTKGPMWPVTSAKTTPLLYYIKKHVDNHAVTCSGNSLCLWLISWLLNKAQSRVLSVDRKVESYQVESLNITWSFDSRIKKSGEKMSLDKTKRIWRGNRSFVTKIMQNAHDTIDKFSGTQMERDQLEGYKITLESIDDKEKIDEEILNMSEFGETIESLWRSTMCWE